MNTALARVRRGYARMWAWAKDTWARFVARIQRRPQSTPGQIDQERETAVSLGLMAEAAAAGGEMSDEQAIFLSAAKTGMRNRIAVLMGIPHRSLAQERELVMIERELARVEGRDGSQPAAPAVRSFMRAPAAANPLMGLLASPVTWVALAFTVSAAWGSVQSWRLNNAKGDLRETRADLAAAIRDLNEVRAINDRLADVVREADEQSRQAAADLATERRRVNELRQRQRERAREAQQVLSTNQPPAWDDRLRDLAAPAGSDSATDNDPLGLPR